MSTAEVGPAPWAPGTYRFTTAGALLREHSVAAARVLAIGFAALLAQLWFSGGTFIAGGDTPPFIRDGAAAELTQLWNHQTSGAGSANSTINQAPEVLLINVVHALGGSNATAQRILFSLILGFAGLGVFESARRLTGSALVSGLAAVLGVLNPLFMTQLPNLNSYCLMGAAGVLWALFFDASRGRYRPWLVGVASIPLFYLSVNPPSLVAVAGSALLYVAFVLLKRGKGGRRTFLAFLGKAVVAAALLNLWWLVPTAQSLLVGGAGTDVTANTNVSTYGFVHARASLIHVISGTAAWTWPHAEYFPWSPRLDTAAFTGLKYILPVAAVGALWLVKKPKRSSYLTGLVAAVILILLVKGLHSPFGGVNLFLYNHLPLFYLFREPVNKFGPLLVIILATFAATTFVELPRLAGGSERRLYVACSVVFILAIGIFSFPLFTGAIIPSTPRDHLPPEHVTVPAYWYAAAKTVDAHPSGKTLVLPLDDFYQVPTTWGYYGTDVIAPSLFTTPVIQQLPGGYFGNNALDNLITSSQNDLLRLDAQTTALASARDLPLAACPEKGTAKALANCRREAEAVHKATVTMAAQTLAGTRSNFVSTLKLLDVGTVLIRHDIDRTYPGRNFADDAALQRGLNSAGLRAPQNIGALTLAAVTTPPQAVLADSPTVAVRSVQSTLDSFKATVTVLPGGGSLGLLESYAPGWTLQTSPSTHASAAVDKTTGYSNQWTLPAGVYRISISYRPQRLATLSWLLSVVSGGLLLIASAVALVKRRTKSTADAVAEATESPRV